MNDELEIWRKQIDIIDEKILRLLAKRVKVIKKIGLYKSRHNLPVLDQARWNQVLNSNLKKAQSLNLSRNFIRKILNIIHNYSLSIEKNNNQI